MNESLSDAHSPGMSWIRAAGRRADLEGSDKSAGVVSVSDERTGSGTSPDISYQNKDIASKIFAEGPKEKSLQVYG